MPPSDRLIVCEGPEDRHFLYRLIRVRNLPPSKIVDTSNKRDPNGGNTKFGRLLQAQTLNKKIRHILIVGDNDEEPEKSFERIQKQIRGVYGRDKVPQQPLERAGDNSLYITVLMVPWTNRSGNLESLLERPARDNNRNIASHVDTFGALINYDNWVS